MKKMAIALAATLALSSSAFAGFHGGGGFRFGGGHYGGWHGGGPFWGSLALGFGLGALLSYPYYYGPAYYYGPGYSVYYAPTYPAYTYAPVPPAYVYDPPAASSRPAASIAPPPKPEVAAIQTPAPVMKGAGQWVPDPEPYSYTPEASARQAAPAIARTVTITHSAGGVPLYVVTR